MKPTVIHNPNSGNNINNCSDPNANNNPDIQPQQQQQQVPQQHPQQQIPQGIYDNGLAGGAANSRRFPFYPSGFDFFDDDELFPEGGVRSRLNRMRDPFGTWGRKRRNSQEHVTPQQTAQAGAVPQSQQIPPQPDEGYEDDFFPQMQPGWGADSAFGRGSRKRNPNLDDDDDFFSYIPQQFRQYIPSNFQFPRMRSHFGRQQVPQPAAANSPQNRNYFPQQQQPQQQSPPQQQQQENRPKFCDAAMQTDADLLAQSQGQGDQPNLNQHGLRNTIDMGQKTNDEVDDAGPRARSAPPDHNENDPNNPNNFASAQSFSSATGFPGQKPQVYAQATATPGAHAQAHAQAQTSNMGTNTGPGTPNGSNIYRQYYYPFENNAPPPSSPPRQQQQYQQPPTTPQTPNQEGQFVRTVPIVVESRKVPAKPKPQPQQQQQQQPQQQTQQAPSQAHPQAQQRQPQQNSQPREIPIRVEHATTQNQAPAAQSPPPQQATEPEQPKAPVAPPDSITKIQAIQKEVMELMLAVEQFKGNGRDKDYMYLDEMLTRNLIKLDDIETDGKENIRLARKEAIKCIQASLCVLEMKADGHIPASERKPDDSENKQGAAPQTSEAVGSEANAPPQEIKSPDDSTKSTADQEKTENVTDKKDGVNPETINTSTTNDNQGEPLPETKESTSVANKENEPENKVVDETKPAGEAVAADVVADVKPAEST